VTTRDVEERVLHVDLTEERKAEVLGAESTALCATRDAMRGYRGLLLGMMVNPGEWHMTFLSSESLLFVERVLSRVAVVG
jgi:hypothetical protein